MSLPLLHICNGFKFSNLYIELFDVLSKLNVSQTVVAPVFNLDAKNATTHNAIRIEYIRRDTSLLLRAMFKRKIRKIKEHIINNLQVDSFRFIHAHSLFSDGAVAYELFKKYNIPYIVAVRNTDVNVFFKYLFFYKYLGYRILEKAEKIIFISPSYKINVLESVVPKGKKNILSEKSVVIPNGVNPFYLRNRNYKKDISSLINIVYTGEFQENKNILSVISAVKILRNNGYNIQFTAIGKGLNDDLSYLKKLIFAQQENSFFKIMNVKSKVELVDLYEKMDVFIMPSFTETFGLVYVEALTQGLPIVYSEKQGFDGFFKNGMVGSSVNPYSVSDIAKGIEYVILNYSVISRNIEEEDLREFDWDFIAQQYYSLYSNITK